MFAQDSLTLGLAPADAICALRAIHGASGVRLDGGGRDQLARLGVRVGAIPIYTSVRLVIGSPAADPRPDHVMLPVSWESSGGPAVFPRMDGILTVRPAPDAGTALTLNVNYDPPLGRLGELIDRMVMHRLADQFVHDFLLRLAATLSSVEFAAD